MVQYLCDKFGPAKYDLDNKAQNCLHWASREGYPKVVQYLIEKEGFDPSLMDLVSMYRVAHIGYYKKTTQQGPEFPGCLLPSIKVFVADECMSIPCTTCCTLL